MIMGGCPYCDASVMTGVGNPPCWSKEVCPECGKTYWLKHSRFDPEAWTQELFDDKYYIDGKTIKEIV
jgi:rRNA maturation protein Nop10